MVKGLFTAQELKQVTGGELLGPAGVWAQADRFFIDSRKIPPAGIFVALKGQRTDGHEFIPQVLGSGTQAVVMSEAWRSSAELWQEKFPQAGFLVVADPLEALGALAAFHLDRFPMAKRIGVTGSNGKTSTKEMIAGILAKKGKIYATEGNFNSEIGLPLTILGLREACDFVVLEMGINHPGEMTFLAKIARPLISVITNVGTAHIGILGSQQAIALEKKEIFMHSGSGAQAVLPGDSPFLKTLTQGFPGGVKTFSLDMPGVKILEDRGLLGTRFQWKNQKINLQLSGRHQVMNALAALTVGELCGVEPSGMKEALEGMKPLFGRSEFLPGNPAILQDCYNANYDSMMGLLETADQTPWEGNKVFVLGSMKELGDQAPEFHRRLGERCSTLKAEGIFFFGEEALESYQVCAQRKFPGRLVWTEDFEALAQGVLEFLSPGDLVILKGSRSTALERLTPLIRGKMT